jgi:hypothetical protein
MSEESKNIEFEQSDPEVESIQRVLAYTDRELRKSAYVLISILEERHRLFAMLNSPLEHDEPVVKQLYPEPSYNDAFFVQDLRLRRNAKYHEESESYDPIAGEDPELAALKLDFRQVILRGAQAQNYVAPAPGKSSDPLDRHLGMTEDTMEPINQPIDALIIAGAKEVSNLMRVHHAVRSLEAGTIVTDTLLVAAGERPAEAHELEDAKKLGYRPADTEYQQLINALEDLHGVVFEDEEKHPAPYGENIPDNTVRRGKIIIDGKVVTVIVVEGTYDRNRRDIMSNELADRSITSETFRAVIPFIPEGTGTVAVASHDTWGKGQEIIGQEIFGLEAHKDVIGTWAFKGDRVIYNEDGEVDLSKAQAVIDEMAKAHFNLVRLRVAAKNRLKALGIDDTLIQ